MDGEPYVIEYNVRMGDPETQVVLPRISSDFVDLMNATANGGLDGVDLTVSDQAATTVVMVSGGYPEAYEKGNVISGIDEVNEGIVFHAGTKTDENGKTLTSGGRVLAITGMGDTVANALENSYNGIAKISWQDEYHRRDIGQDILRLLD